MNILKETGTVVRISGDITWVETVSRSTCAQCSAKSVCGQSTLSRWASSANLLPMSTPLAGVALGDQMEIAFPANALVSASLLVYLLPLLFLLIGGALGFSIHPNDLFATLGAISGFIFAVMIVQKVSRRWARDPRYSPTFSHCQSENFSRVVGVHTGS